MICEKNFLGGRVLVQFTSRTQLIRWCRANRKFCPNAKGLSADALIGCDLTGFEEVGD
jgi:hypothetical protein